MTSVGAALAPATMAWAERCLTPHPRLVGAARLGGPTGPWLLRLRHAADEVDAARRLIEPSADCPVPRSLAAVPR